MSDEKFLKNLNESQKEAVLHKDGPMLVLAGAGAGKTRAISLRVTRLVSQGVDPQKILAVTFTNKAAAEMRERITDLMNVRNTRFSSQVPFISTFHSLGVFMLRKSGRVLDIPKSFKIMDREDSLSLTKQAVKDLEMDPKQFQPSKMQALISRNKGDLVDKEQFIAEAGEDYFPRHLGKVWDRYEEYLKKEKAVDFGDLVSKPVFMMQKDREARDYYQNLWDYILIDEYQDTNKSQYKLSKLLADKHKNICAIGDIDQCIYAFRGADFRNIMNFEKDYPGHKSIIFKENYRSTGTILEAASNVIEKNRQRKSKELVAVREKGAEISIFMAENEQREAEYVVRKIKKMEETGSKPSEFAVLYRANFQSRVLEEECLRLGVSYQVLGVRFYERKEVKDIFSFLRASLNTESILDMKRIINVPPRGIGKVTLAKYFSGKKLPAEAEKKVKAFFKLLESIKNKMQTGKASEVIRFVMKETGYEKFLSGGCDDDKERLGNLKELVNIATRYDDLDGKEGIEKMLEEAALVSDQDNIDKNKESVRLMTVHAAKGLEFENVFIVGLEEGLFPHSGFGDNTADKEEEERRLFYVALTRAKERLFLSFALSRTVFGSKQLNSVSSFVSDIPNHLVKLEQQPYRIPDEDDLDVVEYD